MLTSKRISPYCPFKTNQRLAKIWILTPRCAVWLLGAMHTAELDSVVRCTPQSFNPQWDAHCEVWLRGGKHTAESSSAVCRVFKEIWCSWLYSVIEHRGAWLCGGKHTAEFDLAVGCTPQSPAPRCASHCRFKCQISRFFVFSCLLHLSTTLYKRNLN